MNQPRASIQVQAAHNSRAVILHPADNVAIAIDPLSVGDAPLGITVAEGVAAGHKVASVSIAEGDAIVKFGQPIGAATCPIKRGEWVHEQNVAMAGHSNDYAISTAVRQTRFVADQERATFSGYRRADGACGTRNYVGILTSVNCSASVARFMAEACNASGILEDFENVDGVVSFVHGTGCGMAANGEGLDILNRTQWGFASNPNLAAVLVVGLGCEVFQIDEMMDAYGLSRSESFRTLTIQESGGTQRAIDAGLEAVREMLVVANRDGRVECPASEITVALQCGGSDGYSGITANPSLGAAVDLLVENGGTAILSETPEIFGAEHLLTRRAVTPEVGERLLERIAWWEAYTARHGGDMNNNPTPGNKAGGLTTILEKSLGATAKGGTTNLNAVYEYAEKVRSKGFVFMDTPGYDPVSITGQVAGGANVVCFTTGRGSAYGCKPAPSIKLATNSAMYGRMRDDMDINCGDVIDGVSVADKGREIFETILTVASGEKTKSEVLGYGDNEFVPWQIGAVM